MVVCVLTSGMASAPCVRVVSLMRTWVGVILLELDAAALWPIDGSCVILLSVAACAAAE